MIQQNLKIIADLQDNASQKLQDLNALMGEFGKGLMTGALVAAGAFIVNEFAGMTKAAIDFGDSLDNMAQRTGVSTDELSKLAYAAQMSDTSLEGIQAGFRKLSQTMIAAQEAGSEQAEIFKQIGVETTDASGKLRDTNDVMEDLADVFKDMPDGAGKTALAMELLGKSGADLIPYLNSGKEGLRELKKEAEEFGNVWSPEQSKQAAEFNDNIDRMGNVFKGLFTQIAQNLLPTLNTLTEAIVQSGKEGGILRSVIDGLVWVFDAFNTILKPIYLGVYILTTAFATLGKVLGGTAAALVEFLKGNFENSKNIISAMKDDINKAGEDIAKFHDKLMNGKPAEEAEKNNEKTGKSFQGVKKSAKEAADELEKYLQNLRKTRDQIGMSDKDKALYDLEQESKKAPNAAARQKFLSEGRSIIEDTEVRKANQKAIEDQAEAQKKLNEARSKEELKTEDIAYENSIVHLSNEERKIAVELRKMEKELIGLSAEELSKLTAERKRELEIQAENARLENLIAETTDKRIEKSRVNMVTLANALQAGRISEQTYLEAVQIEMERMKDKSKEVADEMTEFFKSAAKNIQTAMGSFLFDFMQGKLGDLSSSIKTVIDRMVADMLAAQLATALFGADFGKQGGNIGGLVGSLGTFISGFRAEGGPVTAGQAYIVGEKRPELFIPDTNGTILPDTSALAGASQMNVTFQLQALDGADTMRVLGQKEREIAQMLISAQRKYNLR